jgi:hypothetical protein
MPPLPRCFASSDAYRIALPTLPASRKPLVAATASRSFALGTSTTHGCVHLARFQTATGFNGHEPMTLGQMLDDADPDLIPSDQTKLEDPLWTFGAWESLAQMNASMSTTEYAIN